MAFPLQQLKIASAVFSAAILLSGCIKGIERGSSSDLQETAPQRTTLPPNFPVPLDASSKVVGVTESASAVPGKKNCMVILSSSTDTVDHLQSYYAYTLTKGGWGVKSLTLNGTSGLKTLFASKGDNQAVINFRKIAEK